MITCLGPRLRNLCLLALAKIFAGEMFAGEDSCTMDEEVTDGAWIGSGSFSSRTLRTLGLELPALVSLLPSDMLPVWSFKVF